MMPEDVSQLNVRIDSSLIESVRRRAGDEERTVAAVVIRALRAYLAVAPARATAGDE